MGFFERLKVAPILSILAFMDIEDIGH